MSGESPQAGSRMVSISIPKLLADRFKALHVDIEVKVVELLMQELKLNPKEEVEVRVELARRYLVEGKALIDREPVEASEKLYKAAEECVKTLTLCFNLEDILKKVGERGRWTATDLVKAVGELAKTIGAWVLDAWDHAWILHVWGFHEAKLDSDDVRARSPYIEKLVELTEERASKHSKQIAQQ